MNILNNEIKISAKYVFFIYRIQNTEFLEDVTIVIDFLVFFNSVDKICLHYNSQNRKLSEDILQKSILCLALSTKKIHQLTFNWSELAGDFYRAEIIEKDWFIGFVIVYYVIEVEQTFSNFCESIITCGYFNFLTIRVLTKLIAYFRPSVINNDLLITLKACALNV